MESEERRTLKQDMKSIEDGGNYLDDVRYPEVRLFLYLWNQSEDFESAAEIADNFKASTEGLIAFNADHFPEAWPLSVFPQFLVEECLETLLAWSLVTKRTENGVTKYHIDRAAAKANRWAPYINKSLEELD